MAHSSNVRLLHFELCPLYRRYLRNSSCSDPAPLARMRPKGRPVATICSQTVIAEIIAVAATPSGSWRRTANGDSRTPAVDSRDSMRRPQKPRDVRHTLPLVARPISDRTSDPLTIYAFGCFLPRGRILPITIPAFRARPTTGGAIGCVIYTGTRTAVIDARRSDPALVVAICSISGRRNKSTRKMRPRVLFEMHAVWISEWTSVNLRPVPFYFLSCP